MRFIIMLDSTFYIHIFRFYAKCLAAPYEELGIELQYLFRQMEKTYINELDEQLAAHSLDILNYFQGEDVSNLQGEFARMFSHSEDEEPLISIRFTGYGDLNRALDIMEEIYDSLPEVVYDETPDSMINFLDWFSYLTETGEILDYLEIFTEFIIPFSNQLFTAANNNYYKELAKGLVELAEIFTEEE